MSKINEETLAILSRVTVTGNNIELTCGQLDRKQYQAVNKVLENMGGKWNRKAKAHIFPDDPTDKLEAVLLTGEIVKPEKYGYFPTPPELAKHVIELAVIMPYHMVLEPSAGQGGIADEIPQCKQIDLVELLDNNVAVLLEKGYNVIQRNFLSYPKEQPLYDRIIMNPPFEKQRDIDHVLHAYSFLKPGGRLVAIMSSSITFRENKKTLEFRQLLDDTSAHVERNPEGSFKVSGTMVNTVTVVMDKPE